MDFLDREKEIAILKDHLTRKGAGMFVLYGRRRVGKTALLQKLLPKLPQAAYHVGTRSTLHEEMGRLSATLAQAWDVPLLAAQPLASSSALMAFLESVRGPAVLVLDEFPFLVASDPSLPGQLQASWDSRLCRGSLKLVFCGSSVGIMEDTFLSRKSPLFGRRTGQLKLGPLAPHYLHEAFPWGAAEVVELAALFGGVPGYLQRLEPGRSLLDNLVRHVLGRGEPLYEEIPFLLREELREPRVYHAILATIAGGARKFGEISSKVGLDRANLTRYLAVLIDLGLVEREVPVTDPIPDKSRKGLYRIAEPFVATWFRFVHPHQDALERGLAREVVEREVRPNLARYLSREVEPVLREMLRAPPLADVVPFKVAAAGRHWSPSAEFDVVFLDEERRRAFVAEVKWSAAKVDVRLLDDLRRRVALDPTLSSLDCTHALLARNGFTGRRRLASDERLVDVSRLKG